MAWRVDLRIPRRLSRQVDRRRLRKAALAALAPHTAADQGQVTVVLIGDAEMQDLNRRFRDRDSSTDVLAFEAGIGPGPEPATAPPYLGDVIISHERALEQALELGHPLMRELEILIIHGVLHLLGFDDETPEARDQMWRAQEEVLRRLEAE